MVDPVTVEESELPPVVVEPPEVGSVTVVASWVVTVVVEPPPPHANNMGRTNAIKVKRIHDFIFSIP
jgi:hypothetical protein